MMYTGKGWSVLLHPNNSITVRYHNKMYTIVEEREWTDKDIPKFLFIKTIQRLIEGKPPKKLLGWLVQEGSYSLEDQKIINYYIHVFYEYDNKMILNIIKTLQNAYPENRISLDRVKIKSLCRLNILSF